MAGRVPSQCRGCCHTSPTYADGGGATHTRPHPLFYTHATAAYLYTGRGYAHQSAYRHRRALTAPNPV
jgi:hypothetical protein